MRDTGIGSNTDHSRVLRLVLAIVAAGLLPACQSGLKEAADEGSGRVALLVGDKAITRDELARRYLLYPLEHRIQLEKPGNRGKDAFVEEVADRIRIAEEGDRLDAKLKQEVDLRVAVAREEIYRDILYRERIFAKVVSPEAIQEYYDDHLVDYQIPEMMHTRQIVVTGREEEDLRNTLDDDARSEQEAKVKIEYLRDQLQEGVAFEELASQYSEHVSAEQGGDMGWIAGDAPGSPGTSSFWRLSPGETSQILEGSGAYYLVKCIERVQARQLPLAQVREHVIHQLAQLHASSLEEERNRFFGELRRRYPHRVTEHIELP